MKIAIILCFSAKYYHRIQLSNVNKLKNIVIPILLIIFIPTALVISQPDLGTSVLIVLSGIIVLWLAGQLILNTFFTHQ